MRPLLVICSIAEALTGLTLVAYPPLVVGLLFGAELSGTGAIMSRIAGMGLIGLGCACWPGKASAPEALCGMTTYSLLAAIYLLYQGVRGEWVGPALWPAVAVHAVTTFLLGRAWLKNPGGR